MKLNLSLLFLVWLSLNLSAQQKEFDLPALLQSGKLTAVNSTVTAIDDQKKGIHIAQKSGEGIVWINDVTFSSGTIEFDVRGKDELQKSFLGVAFHGADDTTFDVVYFRPFNFHATDPIRKIHAVQYVSHPTYTWKKLRDEKNGIYEKAVINPPDPNGWFHARIEIAGDQITVFINDDKTPSLTVTKLTALNTGKLGLWIGGELGGDFADLKITQKK